MSMTVQGSDYQVVSVNEAASTEHRIVLNRDPLYPLGMAPLYVVVAVKHGSWCAVCADVIDDARLFAQSMSLVGADAISDDGEHRAQVVHYTQVRTTRDLNDVL